jgi:Threonine synthase N terminus
MWRTSLLPIFIMFSVLSVQRCKDSNSHAKDSLHARPLVPASGRVIFASGSGYFGYTSTHSDDFCVRVMRYTSTRSHDVDCSFEQALLDGYAADGGLYVPRSSTLPQITGATLHAWQQLSYPDLMQRVVRLFISTNEVTNAELELVCRNAMQGFVNPDQAVPLVKLKSSRDDKSNSKNAVYVAELFHGPTYCFKDLGMRAVIHLLHLFATKRQAKITLLVNTTGDTGPAAARAVADLESMDNNDPKGAVAGKVCLAVHYPLDQISDLQRRQMTTLPSSRVRVVAYQGGGDDMDLPIKRLLASQQHASNDAATTMTSDTVWTGVNSYNIVRMCVLSLCAKLCRENPPALGNACVWELSAAPFISILADPMYCIIHTPHCFALSARRDVPLCKRYSTFGPICEWPNGKAGSFPLTIPTWPPASPSCPRCM